MSAPDFTRPGSWRDLLAQALKLTDHLARMIDRPVWSFGGGTVLMLRLNHRLSKDIDLFVPDPQYLGRSIQVESSAEIIAKKMHHRGHLAKARDLFDLCAVADLQPEAIDIARPFMAQHAQAFLARLNDHRDLSRTEFDRIDRLAYSRSFDDCLVLAEEVLGG